MSNPFETIGFVLDATLAAAVPLWIQQYKAKGGPDDRDRERVREMAQLIGEKGDILVFNALAEALAVLSFCPGGVKFRGERWETKPKGESDDGP